MNRLIYLLALALVASCNFKPLSNKEEAASSIPSEKYRPQFHFTPEAHWMNDPNGLVYYKGEYHLFYQYYPDSTVWGPMHWGHAVSNDLIHWDHLPIALYPDSLGYIFSGSAVIDKANSSGLGTKENSPMVAIFTYHHPELEKSGSSLYQNQGVAFSLDSGRTWAKYAHNPVLKNPGIRDFRDPKVFWFELKQKWIMSLAVLDHIRFYSSRDLLTWTLESEFGKDVGAHGGVWECPDLFPLDNKWVLLVSINPGGPNRGSATQYFIGNFNGKVFTPDDTIARWIDYGRDNYAGVTWSNIPEENGRRIFIGWMSNWDYGQVVPTKKWRSAMTGPRALSLNKDKNVLRSYPVKEVDLLHGNEYVISGKSNYFDLNPQRLTMFDLQFKMEASDLAQSEFEIVFTNTASDTLTIKYEAGKWIFNRDQAGDNAFSKFFAGPQIMPMQIIDNNMNLRLLVDVASIELFVNYGDGVMTSIVFPREPFRNVHLLKKGENVMLTGSLFEMRGIW
jgi:fructan beta-fructosidase